MRNLKFYSFFLFLFLSFLQLKAENEFKLFPKITTNKLGTLIGIQRGKFFTIELGIEQQKKQVKLFKPKTIAWNFVVEYAWQSNTMGYKLGSWYKPGRAAFSYGINAIAFTDFDQVKPGFSPELGFKLIGFHFITSYNFLFNNSANFEQNTFHLSIRYFLSRKRKFKIEKNKK